MGHIYVICKCCELIKSKIFMFGKQLMWYSKGKFFYISLDLSQHGKLMSTNNIIFQQILMVILSFVILRVY